MQHLQALDRNLNELGKYFVRSWMSWDSSPRKPRPHRHILDPAAETLVLSELLEIIAWLPEDMSF